MLYPSLEVSGRDDSNDGSEICFKGVMWKIIPKFPIYSFFIWSLDYLFHKVQDFVLTRQSHIQKIQTE